MKITVQPSSIKGKIVAPASKSAMQRGCAAALLRKGTTIIHNPGISADDKAALDIIRQLGAEVIEEGEIIRVVSKGVMPASSTIHCGESGLSVRMFTSIAALSDQPISITGSGSLLKRSLHFFDQILPHLEVSCESNQGLLPLRIKGPMKPKDIEVDGSLSSQFLTGLLFAYGAADASDVTIRVRDLNSKPYIDLTLQIMAHFGIKTPVNSNYEAFYFPKQSVTAFENDTIHFSTEGDWSGASFLLVAGAIAGQIIVEGLDVFSKQADKNVLQALMGAGVNLSIQPERIEVRESVLKAFHFNATDCPDLFPPLVSLAAYCDGTTVIEGVHRLAHKESNRALTLQEEFGKLGVEIVLQDDLMVIRGGRGVKPAEVQSHHDHRIAMACAVAALKAGNDVTIEGAEAVNKSYPQFWDHLQSLTRP